MGKQALYTIGLTLLMATLWSSCKDDSQPKPPAVSTKPGLIYLINEGNFQWGNASLASYDPEKKEFTDKLYESVNGFPIGDVFQSMVRHNGAFYLVLNNSGKILQLDTSNLELKRTFSGFTSPRYMLPLQGDKALVTDLYSKSVSVLDLVSGSITKTVRIDGWTEQILQIEDEIWIGNRGNNKVYLLDANALTLKDSL